MAQMNWTLESWLEAHGVTRYELAQNMGGNLKTRLTSLYRSKDPKRVDLNVMADIVSALRHITGKEVTPNDLLEFIPDPEPDEMDDETKAWMDAPIDADLEPYDWGDVDPEALGEPLHFDAKRGWVKGG